MAYSVAGKVRRVVTVGGGEEHGEPCLDDPCTGGALLYLLGREGCRVWRGIVEDGWMADLTPRGAQGPTTTEHASLGRACFAVAVALGRWS